MNVGLHDRPPIERGDPARIALRIEFVPNLDPGFRVPDEDRSWGRLTLWAGGSNLCGHIDQREVRGHCEWYLLPFLEWLERNWDFLFHEQRPPVANEGTSGWSSFAATNRPERFETANGGWDERKAEENYAWGARHALRSCRTGGLFPDIVLRRWRHDLEVSWGPASLPGVPAGFRFLCDEGVFRVPAEEAAEVLHAVLTQAADALALDTPESDRLASLRRRVAAIGEPGRASRRVAVLAGLGDTVEEWEGRWQRLSQRLGQTVQISRTALRRWCEPSSSSPLCVSGSCEAAVMFGSVSPTLAEEDVYALAMHAIQGSADAGPGCWPRPEADPVGCDGHDVPWREGYELAEEWSVRSGLGPSSEGYVDIDGHLADLGVSVGEIPLHDVGISGVALLPADASPRILVNSRHSGCKYPTGRRFVLAHELCHLLHDGSAAQDLALVSGPWAPRRVEQRANAFAAALLMPRSMLQHELATLSGPLDGAGLLGIAQRLWVSPTALSRHLQNLGFLDEADREALLDDLAASQVRGLP